MSLHRHRMSGPRRRLRVALAVGLGWASSVAGAANAVEPTDVPFLWMIDATPPSFLYGTIHIPDERVTTLPDVVTAAFDASDVMYTEIPMDAASQQKAAMGFVLKGRTLREMVDDDLWTRLDRFLQKRGLSAMMLNSLSPAAVALQLMMVDDMATFTASPPLDALLESRAKAEGKSTRALETIDEQVEIFTALSDREQVRLLDDTLEQLEEFEDVDRNALEETIVAYLSGNVDQLEELVYQFSNPNDPFDRKIMHALVTVRNERMADRIRARLTEEPDRVHFFAVGALHYPRRDGILALLEKAGFDIDRMGPRDIWKIEDRLAVPAR